jgi:transcriptional regulator with XRE-family HTH domain
MICITSSNAYILNYYYAFCRLITVTRLVSRNVRFKLFAKEVPRSNWTTWLASHANLGLAFCRDLIMDGIADESLTPTQLTELSKTFEGLAEDGSDLLFTDLLEASGRNMLAENLKFLFDDLERGGKKKLAEFFNVDPTTISRWLAGSSEPQGPGLRRLVSYFNLPMDTDLRRDPVFLSLEPVSSVAKRHWVRDRLDKLSDTDLQELYPALRRMLAEDR